MKIFLIGLPKSGRSTVAKDLANRFDYTYIDAVFWIRSSFRHIEKDEHPHQYEDEFQNFLSQKLLVNPYLVANYVSDIITELKMSHLGLYPCNPRFNIIIDGILSPKDFISLFDYTKDVVIFLNRIDNESEIKDHENIGISVIRDYCFWLASANLLPKERWMEFNFRIPGEDSDFVKVLGSKNSVFIVKSIKKVISHIKEKLNELSK